MRRTGSHLSSPAGLEMGGGRRGQAPHRLVTLEDNASGASTPRLLLQLAVEVFEDTCWLLASPSRNPNLPTADSQLECELEAAGLDKPTWLKSRCSSLIIIAIIIIGFLADDSITNEHLNGDAGWMRHSPPARPAYTYKYPVKWAAAKSKTFRSFNQASSVPWKSFACSCSRPASGHSTGQTDMLQQPVSSSCSSCLGRNKPLPSVPTPFWGSSLPF